MKRVLWAVAAYALCDKAYHFHTTGNTPMLTVFFIAGVSAIYHTFARHPWQRS